MEEYLKTFSEPVLGHEKPANIEFETPFPLLTVDLSKQTERHVIVASGTEEVYQGHPTTLALPGTSTIFCVWTLGHGGVCGPLKRSVDGGRSWSEYLPVPENWSQVKNCPVLYRLPDPDGRCRLFVFAGQGPDGKMHQATSEDNGETWNPMESNGLECVMPFCSILPVENGKKLLGLTNIRREQSDCEESYSNVLAQSFSEDGGFSWSPWRVILDHPDQKFCEPWLVPSPNGEQLVCLIRENCGRMSWYMTTEDEGRSWSEAQRMPVGLAGDRHVSRYAPDGRLVVVFRDRATNSETSGDFVAWVGHYEDILAGNDGCYRIKLLHSYNGYDCGYPGLELMEDGTFVATTYIKYAAGKQQNSVVCVRFKLDEMDGMLSMMNDCKETSAGH